MFDLINANTGKTITAGTLHSLERLQERIDPLGLNTEIVDDRRALYEPKVASMIDDNHEDIFMSMKRKPTAKDIEPHTDGIMIFVIDDTVNPVKILQKHDDILVIKVADAKIRDKIIENGYEHDGRLYKPAFIGASQARAGYLTLISENKIEKLSCDRIPHLDHVHHKSTIDNITILHQVDFPVCD